MKVYTKDGKQWSVIEVSIDLAVEGPHQGFELSGRLPITATLDVVTDGSANEGTMTTKADGKVTGRLAQREIELEIKAEGSETRTPVK
jgi:hypothetical protein